MADEDLMEENGLLTAARVVSYPLPLPGDSAIVGVSSGMAESGRG